MDETEKEIWEFFLNQGYSFELTYCSTRDFGNPGIQCIEHNFDFLELVKLKHDIPTFRVVPENLPPMDFIILSANRNLFYFFTESIYGNLKFSGSKTNDVVFGRICIAMNVFSSGCCLLGFRFTTNECIEEISYEIKHGSYIKKEVSGRKTKGAR